MLAHIHHVIWETITPSWLNSVPKNYGEAKAGSIKADEWRVLFTLIALTDCPHHPTAILSYLHRDNKIFLVMLRFCRDAPASLLWRKIILSAHLISDNSSHLSVWPSGQQIYIISEYISASLIHTQSGCFQMIWSQFFSSCWYTIQKIAFQVFFLHPW